MTLRNGEAVAGTKCSFTNMSHLSVITPFFNVGAISSLKAVKSLWTFCRL